MKKIIKTIAALALCMPISSCLELEPKDQLAETNLWASPDDFELFANQFYGWTITFSDVVSENGKMSDCRSDILADKSGINEVSAGINTIPASDGNYTGGYSRIRRCNLLLQNAASYPNQTDIAQSVGEAYFFRAYCYYELVRLFGDVIIVDTPIDVNDPKMNAKRDNRTDVIKFAIEDLHKAADLLKDASEVEYGRISSQGALAFLSRVALFEGTWQKFRGNQADATPLLDEAAKSARKVIDSGKYELFYNSTLEATSQKYMFILENQKSNPAGLGKSSNKEYILARCYDEAILNLNRNITKAVLNNAEIVSRKMIQMYLCQDGLPIEKSKLFKGYDKMDSEWIDRDNRMRYNLMRPGDAFWNGIAPDQCRLFWDGGPEDLAHSYTKSFVPTSATRYFPQKWAAERQVETNKENYDYPVIRYAEVLLNYAEAVYERDGRINDEDLDISLNLTRQRTNATMPKLSNAFASTNGLDMREEIRRERTVEFFNEGFRLDDLKRWKTAEVEMPMDFLGVKWTGTEYATKGGSLTYDLNGEGCIIYQSNRKWAEKNYLFPIPTDQLQLNKNLNQNPGW